MSYIATIAITQSKLILIQAEIDKHHHALRSLYAEEADLAELLNNEEQVA